MNFADRYDAWKLASPYEENDMEPDVEKWLQDTRMEWSYIHEQVTDLEKLFSERFPGHDLCEWVDYYLDEAERAHNFIEGEARHGKEERALKPGK